jgi:DNA-binding transcriptional LysR family regulator
VVAHVLPDFLAQCPKVQVRLLTTDRRVDLIGEGIDVAIRVRSKLDSDATLVMRSFGQSQVLAVASPGLLAVQGAPQVPDELARLPALSMYEHDGAQVWALVDAAGKSVNVEMQARLICGEFSVLLEAARRGMGVALLPEWIAAPAIARGELQVVLPDWSTPQGTMHFVYPSRRGLLPAVRAFVDFLAERLPEATRANHEECKQRPLRPLPAPPPAPA